MEIHRWQQIIVHLTDGKKNSYENFEKEPTLNLCEQVLKENK